MKLSIWSPDYSSSSGGICVLHYFGYLAHKLGHEVKMECNYLNQSWEYYSNPNQQFDPEYRILPEIFPATLKSKVNVIRWVLYYPGKILNGPKIYPNHEMIVSYHAQYNRETIEAANGNHVFEFTLPYSDMSGIEFNYIRQKKTGIVWIGKGTYVRVPEISHLPIITRDWPKYRHVLISILKSTEYFFSFDKHTSMNDEALLCGCNVMIWHEDRFLPYINENAGLIAMNEEHDKILVESFLQIAEKYFKKGDTNHG